MLKKLSLILIAAGLLLLPSCSCNINIDPSMTITYEEDGEFTATLKNLDNDRVELYTSMDLFDISNSEEAEALKNEKGYESVVIDDVNYMITIIMTQAQYQQAVNDLVAEIDELIDSTLLDSMVSAEHSEDFTVWNVVTNNTELSFFETMYNLSLAIYSTDYFKIAPNIEHSSITFNWYGTDGTLIYQEITDLSAD